MIFSPKTLFLAWFALVAGFLVGVALGGGLALDPAPPPADAPQATPGTGAPVQDPLAECDLPDPDLRRLALQLHLQRERLRGLQLTQHELLGDPVAFDDGLDPKWLPDAIRAAAARAFDGEKSLGMEIDCEEFPCMVAADFDATSPMGGWSPSAAMRDQGYGGTTRDLMTFDGATGRSVSIFAPDITLDDKANRRVRLRAQALLTPWTDP